ncbi:unnamed protein product [Blepharisma stoltei]|uniref:Uncharacterized protein n=1 Tax=Blepharisma stoltei TaxID=1481888 RepID=A0AAU9J6S9_9CILI|nr:unnamed protein product [Blepharisma stoltei]
MEPVVSIHRAKERIEKFENEDQISLCSESTSSVSPIKSLFRDSVQASKSSSFANSLPKLFNGSQLDFYSLLTVYSNISGLNILIPESMIRDGKTQLNHMLWTKKNGQVCSKPCLDSEFFALSQNKIDENIPIFCCKVFQKETEFIYSAETAEKIWRFSHNEATMMQNFICPHSNPASITRVLWKFGRKNKYFSIISRLKQSLVKRSKKRNTQTLSQSPDKSNSFYLSNFRYTDMMLKTTKSLNNPYRIKAVQKPIKKSSLSFSTKITGNLMGTRSETFIQSEKSVKTYFVNTNTSEDFFVIENKPKIQEIDDMVDQIVSFLNHYFCKEEKLKGLILDFIQSKDRKWVFLSCKEYTTSNSSPIEYCNPRIRQSKTVTPSRIRSYSENSQEIMKEDSNESIDRPLESMRCITPSIEVNLPFKIKCNPKQNRTMMIASDKDLLERCTKVNQKIDYLVNLKPVKQLKSVDFKEESIKAYQMRYNLNAYATFDQTAKASNYHESLQTLCPVFNQKSGRNPKNALVVNKVNDHAKRHLAETSDSLDEMKIQCDLMKVKKKELIQRYGGDEFWNKFIISLYKKLIGNSSLSKYFMCTSMNMIIQGMFKVFNGNTTLEFRRSVRSVHQNLKIPEKDFDCYANTFYSTLKEFEIEEEDRQIIMTQIRSMKCLICK